MQLHRKTALVTGGTRGIGAATRPRFRPGGRECRHFLTARRCRCAAREE
ncbi:MAG: hypothetical protein WDN28_06990 [Chthoniobacter sp.]